MKVLFYIFITWLVYIIRLELDVGEVKNWRLDLDWIVEAADIKQLLHLWCTLIWTT